MTTLAANPEPSTLEFVAEFMELIGAAATSLANIYERICQVRGVPNLTVPGAAGTDPGLLAKQAEIAERCYHASLLGKGTGEHFRIADVLAGKVLAVDSGNQLARFVRARMLRDTREYAKALPIALGLLMRGLNGLNCIG
ncbi:MAG TPA: hypothetical protein VJ914_08995 [Pseudonocardiaceae bacterium]|nr:hypothetical protein [Pseudonocardiaceae bacterium]